MGGEQFGRQRGSLLGRKVWGRPIEAGRSQKIRSVIPEVDPSTLG